MTDTTTGVEIAGAGPDRRRRQVVRLAWFTVGWNVLEAVVALGEGAARNSSALVGFGLDSTIEVSSAAIVLWQFHNPMPELRERRALRGISISFFALAVWLVAAAGADLIARSAPEASRVGIALAVASLIVMPVLAITKQRLGRQLGAPTVMADSAQTWLCTSLSGVLLVGLIANDAFGWWWADPSAALVIGAVAAREGLNTWRGHNCCAPVPQVYGGADREGSGVGATACRDS